MIIDEKISDIEARVSSCARSLAYAEKSRASTHAELSKVSIELSAARSKLAEDESAYVDAPSDLAGQRVKASREAVELVLLRHTPANARYDQATEILTDTKAAHEKAVADLARAEEIAELRKEASIETMRSRIAEPWAAILSAHEQIEINAPKIAAAQAASHRASEKLQKLGVNDCPPLDVSIALLPFLEYAVVKHGMTGAVADPTLNHLRHTVSVNPNRGMGDEIPDGIFGSLLNLLHTWRKRGPYASWSQERALQEIAILRRSRRAVDAAELRFALVREEENARQADNRKNAIRFEKECDGELHGVIKPIKSKPADPSAQGVVARAVEAVRTVVGVAANRNGSH